MRIGVPKEMKGDDHRVAVTPEGVGQLVRDRHTVCVQRGAGLGSGFEDVDYQARGAQTVGAEEAWDAGLVVKVMAPTEAEYGYLRDQMLFTFLHLSGATPTLTDALLAAGTCAIGYETVEDAFGQLPLLAPMSAIAGNMATLMGAFHLAQFNGGRGVHVGQVLGRRHGQVLIIGDGVVGRHAARTAIALGAEAMLAGRHPERTPDLRHEVGEPLLYLGSTATNLARAVRKADIVIGCVMERGARAPWVVTEEMVTHMRRGAVILDVSIDQGGCVETSRPTTHQQPVFTHHGVLHYCVTNMPSAYPQTATLALTAATFPYVEALANLGLDAFSVDPGLARGLQTRGGYVTNEAVADNLGLRSAFRVDPAISAEPETSRMWLGGGAV